MNPITSFFKFLYMDILSDIQVIKRIFTEKGFFDDRVQALREEMKKNKTSDFLKYIFPKIIIWAAFFFAGWFLSSQYYQGLCNQYIFDNYISPARHLSTQMLDDLIVPIS